MTDLDRQARVGRRIALEPSFVLCLLGLAISVYLTVEHFSASSTLACPEGTVINCAKVTTGPWSFVIGIPVAVLGLAYFVVMSGLLSPPAWRLRRLDVPRVIGCVAGVLMVLYLVYVEIFVVGAICLWCTGVHLITLALFGTGTWRVLGREPAGTQG